MAAAAAGLGLVAPDLAEATREDRRFTGPIEVDAFSRRPGGIRGASRDGHGTETLYLEGPVVVAFLRRGSYFPTFHAMRGLGGASVREHRDMFRVRYTCHALDRGALEVYWPEIRWRAPYIHLDWIDRGRKLQVRRAAEWPGHSDMTMSYDYDVPEHMWPERIGEMRAAISQRG